MDEPTFETRTYSVSSKGSHDFWVHARYAKALHGPSLVQKIDRIRLSQGIGRRVDIPLSEIDRLCEILKGLVSDNDKTQVKPPF